MFRARTRWNSTRLEFASFPCASVVRWKRPLTARAASALMDAAQQARMQSRAAMSAAGLDRESLLLIGQGGELYMGEDGEGGSAEERIRTLLGDSAGSAGLARRRIRRPLGGGYAAQGLAFSEREAGGGDSLNELLAHLTATRSGMAGVPGSSRGRDAADSTAALTALEKMLAEEESRPSFAQGIVENTPAHAHDMALRSRFVQELTLTLTLTPTPTSTLTLSPTLALTPTLTRS